MGHVSKVEYLINVLARDNCPDYHFSALFLHLSPFLLHPIIGLLVARVNYTSFILGLPVREHTFEFAAQG